MKHVSLLLLYYKVLLIVKGKATTNFRKWGNSFH